MTFYFTYTHSQRQIDFADLNVSDPDSVYPQDFTMTVLDGDNYSLYSGIEVDDALEISEQTDI